MATTGSKQGGGGGSSKSPPPPPPGGAATAAAAADQELDPRYEWQETASSFILRIHLSGFRKQDFRVQVDGAGRLTVRGQRADAAADADARHSRFSKVFQLPSTSNLDDISGRFDAGVLTLTVPKRPPAPSHQPQVQAPPAVAGDPKSPPQQEQDQRKAKGDKKPKDEAAATKKPAAHHQVADAKSGKPEQDQQHEAAAAPPPAATKQEGKPKAVAPAAAADTPTKPAPTPPPPESLAERVKRRAEEERAKAAAEAAAEEAERHRKACRGFKERVAEELQGLAASEWAEGLVDTVKKNREVIAVAVAAFSLGVFISTKLLSRSRNGN